MIGQLVSDALRSAAQGIGLSAGWRWGDRLSGGQPPRSIWGADILGNQFVVMAHPGRRPHYVLHVVTGGEDIVVGTFTEWPKLMACMQTWQTYLHHGGTVTDWLRASRPPVSHRPPGEQIENTPGTQLY